MHLKPTPLSSADRRNAMALQTGQLAWDTALPPEDDGWEDYLAEQADLLLSANSAELVPFFGNHPIARTGYAEAATDALIDADDHDCELLQLVLAVRRGDYDLAAKLAMRFEDALVGTARNLIKSARAEASNGE